MGDESKAVSFQPGAGQLSDNASGAEQGKGQSPQYITKDDFEGLREELSRKIQSLTDKASARIEERVAQRISEIDSAARLLGADPSAVEAAKQRVVMEELARVPEAKSAPQPAQAASQTQQQSDDRVAYANAAAARLVKKYGVSLNTEEVQGLPQTDDPDEWLDALEQKLADKKAQGAIPSAARVPSTGGVGLPIDKTTMLAELESLLAHPSKEGLPRIRELRAKLNQ